MRRDGQLWAVENTLRRALFQREGLVTGVTDRPCDPSEVI